MEIAKLTSKGQLTLPIEIRRQLGLNTGDKIAFIEKDGAFMLVNADSLSITHAKSHNANIRNVVATMRIEGLEVPDETMRYMRDRLDGKTSIDDRINQIRQKYKRD